MCKLVLGLMQRLPRPAFRVRAFWLMDAEARKLLGRGADVVLGKDTDKVQRHGHHALKVFGILHGKRKAEVPADMGTHPLDHDFVKTLLNDFGATPFSLEQIIFHSNLQEP